MKHHLFNFIAAVSLLLNISFAAFWTRGRTMQDGIIWTAFNQPKGQGTSVVITSGRSQLELSIDRSDYGPGRRLLPEILNDHGWRAFSIRVSSLSLAPHQTRWWTACRKQDLGPVSATDHANPKSLEAWTFGCKIWIFSLLTALLPALWLTTRIRQKRQVRRGFCRTCGYDLRASPDRCPECGTFLSNVG